MFKIQFSNLSVGQHEFQFRVDDTFFEAFEYDEISNSAINITVDLEKTERFLKLDFQFSGECFVPCDRCLDPIEIPVNHEETLIVNFGNANDFDSEVWTIASKEHELILDNFIYETLVLLRPLSVTHDIEKCNPKMLEKLQNSNNAEANRSLSGVEGWDALQALKDQLSKK